MQLSIPVKALQATGSGLSTKGATLTSPLVLAKNPDQPLEAASKSYVDNKVVSISATTVLTGVLSAQRFPQFTGDLVKAIGSDNITLSVTGTEAGLTAKVSVNAQGRVTASYSLTADDIPSLNWNKINTNKPVSLSGYGIADGLSKGGSILTGFLSLTNPPTQSLHAINKAYIDDLFNASTKYVTGDVVRRASVTTPSGFLRLNGAELSKTAYSALYAIVGDGYSTVGNVQPGAGQPWRQQYEFNTTQNGDVATWTLTNGFTYYPGNQTAVMLKNRIHLLYANNTQGMGYQTTVNTDGTLAAWSDTGTIVPPAGSRLGCTLLVAYNRLYLLGGYDNGVASATETFSAPINFDGTIGAWVAGPTLPIGVHGAKGIVTKNRIYLIGGELTGVPQSQVCTATIDSGGFTSNWVTVQNLPFATTHHACAVVKNRVYVFGGYGASNGGYRDTIYSAVIDSSGVLGEWSLVGWLPSISAYGVTFVVRNRIYLIVGYNGTARVTTVYSASINADGTLGTWVTAPSLPNTIQSMSVFITSSKVVLIGAYGDGQSYGTITGDFTGGQNDYSAYYDGTIVPTVTTNFNLPDYTNKEVHGFKYFIKQ